MGGSGLPDWFPEARHYYSELAGEAPDPVRVFDVTDCGDEANDESPGTLRLRLEPRSRFSPRVRVLDSDGGEVGLIRPEGLVPGLKYAMRRDGELVWSLSVRSIVRRRHVLKPSRGDSWEFRTPFFGVRLTGTTLGVPGLLGVMGPTTHYWSLAFEPGRDTTEVLAAVAFLHRQWGHW